MKVLLSLAAILALGLARPAPNPEADPKAFFPLGAIAIPAITNNALIDGLLLGKVAFLKAAILANLLLGSSDASDAGVVADEYGAPVDTYGAPVGYEEPVAVYDAPAVGYEEPVYAAPVPAYDAPAPAYEEPVDTYGAPVAAPIDSYGTPAYYKF